ncbi:TIGR00266 family protein [Permianibacter fluminis]|uniref:TIGR00266 family protein n=1 Tax=Permianibacter fluminis TaxID=2738515 RepID=UPI001B7D86CC|nr:TIGR00266 family protein [Permianibacter fluminis]
MNYQVILLPQDASAERVAAFAKLFKSDEEKARACFARAPMVLKANLDADGAEKYRIALGRADIQCEVKRMAVSTDDSNANATTVMSSAAVARSVAAHTERTSADSTTQVASGGNGGGGSQQLARDSGFSDDALPGFKFRIEGRPDFSFLTVKLPANKTLKVEASAMATMDSHIQMKSKLRGGLGRFLTGESIVMNEFTAANMPGEIGIAPPSPGDLRHVYLNGETIYLQNSAFVAADMGVTIESQWQGFTKGFFSGESLFLIRAQGTGDLWFNSYGGVIDLDVDGDYVVDTGNIVAFTEGLDYKISKVGGYKSLFFSGEGLVCRFSGKGKVWIQTRAVGAFAAWAHPFRPLPKRS